jgi:hypothetical protein
MLLEDDSRRTTKSLGNYVPMPTAACDEDGHCKQKYIPPHVPRMYGRCLHWPSDIITSFDNGTQSLLEVIIVWGRIENISLEQLDIPSSKCTLVGQQAAVALWILLPRTISTESVSLNHLPQLLMIERWIYANELDDFQWSFDGRHVQIQEATSFEVVGHDHELLRPQRSSPARAVLILAGEPWVLHEREQDVLIRVCGIWLSESPLPKTSFRIVELEVVTSDG